MANWALQPGRLTSITLENKRLVSDSLLRRHLCIIISTAEGVVMTLDALGRVSSQSKKKMIADQIKHVQQ